jgi:hypothetical protein
VYQRAQKAFRFDTLTPIKAKGYTEPVPVFRPMGQLAADGCRITGNNGEPISDGASQGDTAGSLQNNGVDSMIIGATNELSVLVAMAKRVSEGTPIGPVILLGQVSVKLSPS